MMVRGEECPCACEEGGEDWEEGGGSGWGQ